MLQTCIFVFFTTFLSLNFASAETFTWKYYTNNDWHTASNWTPTGIPQNGDTIVIPTVSGGSAPSLFVDLSLPASTLKLEESSVFNIGSLSNFIEFEIGEINMERKSKINLYKTTTQVHGEVTMHPGATIRMSECNDPTQNSSIIFQNDVKIADGGANDPAVTIESSDSHAVIFKKDITTTNINFKHTLHIHSTNRIPVFEGTVSLPGDNDLLEIVSDARENLLIGDANLNALRLDIHYDATINNAQSLMLFAKLEDGGLEVSAQGAITGSDYPGDEITVEFKTTLQAQDSAGNFYDIILTNPMNDLNYTEIYGNDVTLRNGEPLLFFDVNAQNLTVTAPEVLQFYDISIFGALQFQGDWNLNGKNLTVGSIAPIPSAISAQLIAQNQEIITVSENFTPSSFIAENSTVIFNGNQNSTVGSYTFHDVTLEKSKANASVTSTGDWNILGDLTLTKGQWILGSNTHSLQKSWDSILPDFSWDATGSTVQFTGLDNATIRTKGPNEAFNDVTILKHALFTYMYLGSDLRILGDLTVASGGLSAKTSSGGISHSIELAGNWNYTDTNNGFTAGTGTVIFNGTNQTIENDNQIFHNLIIDSTYLTMEGHYLDIENLTFQKSGTENPVLDIQDNTLMVNGQYNAMIKAPDPDDVIMGRLRATGNPTVRRTHQDTQQLGITEFYGTGAMVDNYSEDFWHIVINDCTLTLNRDITVWGHSGVPKGALKEPVEQSYPNDSDLMGIHIHGPNASLKTNGHTIDLYGSLFDSVGDRFVHDNGELRLLGTYPALIAGDNTFHKLTINKRTNSPEDVSGKIVYFEKGKTTTIQDNANAGFFVEGDNTNQAPNNPLNPETLPDNTGSQWVYLVSSHLGKKWTLSRAPQAALDLRYVYLRDSHADPGERLITDIQLDNIYDCPGWITKTFVHYSETLDTNGNGRIDAIRVTAYEPLIRSKDGAYDNLVVDVTGYNLRSPSFADEPTSNKQFLILLEEQSFLDTGASPTWHIVRNTSLRNVSAEPFLLGLYTDKNEEIAFDRAPPIIAYTLAVANSMRKEIFVHFSEPIVDASNDDWNNNFSFNGQGSITAVKPLMPSSQNAIQEAVLTLSQPVTALEIYDNTHITVNDVKDIPTPASTLPADSDDPTFLAQDLLTPTHRVSDVALGILGDGMVEPVKALGKTLASDTSGMETLTRFDGTESLQKDDIELTAHLHNDLTITGDALKIYWGSTVPLDYQFNSLWLPHFGEQSGTVGNFSGLVPQPWPQASSATMQEVSKNRYTHTWSADNLANATNMEFFFLLPAPQLYAGRIIDESASDWFRKVRPWTIKIQDIAMQAGGVSIANNIINPLQNEAMQLYYTLTERGPVTIQVFELGGDLVEVLQRSEQAPGKYTVSWNGRNRSDKIVARGLYFVRFVGPGGLDQTRKILVVK